MKSCKVNVKAAIECYYGCYELSSDDIRKIFGEDITDYAMAQLRKKAQTKTAEMNKPVFDRRCLNIECAYLAWGLDITELEHRYNKLKKLGLV